MISHTHLVTFIDGHKVVCDVTVTFHQCHDAIQVPLLACFEILIEILFYICYHKLKTQEQLVEDICI